jgi:hypothetical protein
VKNSILVRAIAAVSSLVLVAITAPDSLPQGRPGAPANNRSAAPEAKLVRLINPHPEANKASIVSGSIRNVAQIK